MVKNKFLHQKKKFGKKFKKNKVAIALNVLYAKKRKENISCLCFKT